ncbi:MAG TPA: ATP synthase F0 subunit B [Bryobacteraceae bacterium]|jgi:F0F1-type ATP synthase membrane subunit b/b'|nr:ATP synthase F0 subunit B [Bryobacteraceae bacterium]
MMLAEEVSEIWLWPNFLILATLLGYLIKKHGSPFFAARSEQVRERLEAGKKAQAEAEKVAAGVRAKLATLDSEIANLKASAHAELERETQRIRRDTDNELQRIEQHTTSELDSLGKRTTLELRQYAASLAVDLAEQKVRARMTPAVQSGLIEGFASDLAARQAVQNNGAQGGAAR